MSHVPQVSVVVSCFNYGQYVTGCLSSIQTQTFTDFEVIVVDDGSTDDSEEQISPFLRDRRFKYIKQPNGGQAKAKNRGVKESQGRFVAFLDADDLWSIDKLEKQIGLFEKTAVGVVYSRSRYIDQSGDDVNLTLDGEYLQPRKGRVSNWLFIDNFVPFSSSVVRRECIDMFGAFDESLEMGIDWDMWLHFSSEYEFDFIDEPLLYYRVGHPGQMSKKTEVRQQCSDRIMEKFLVDFPELIDTRTLKSAFYHTYCNRGSYFRGINKLKAFKYFLLAIREKPLNSRAYKGFVKCLCVLF